MTDRRASTECPGLDRSAKSEDSGSSARLDASFRDPGGFLFRRDGVLYRQINQRNRQDYDATQASGLYSQLVDRGLLVQHEEVEQRPMEPSNASLVIKPEEIPFISYPYEWCFSQLKDAALATLEIQLLALEKGLSLKDASAYNIQFVGHQPILIDTLSFESYREGEPWVAYRQFCQHFLAPLALMAYRDVRLGQLLAVHIDGMPLDLASRLLPWRTRFRLGLSMHLHLHAKAQSRYSETSDDSRIKSPPKPRPISKVGLEGLLGSLRRTIEKLSWSPGASEWVDYYEKEHRYTDAALNSKTEIVDNWIEQVAPTSVWDLGANTGFFSRLASERDLPTVAFDVDLGAVERHYLECKTRAEDKRLPLFQDLTNPSSALGWAGTERSSLEQRGPVDLVLALALIHHLAISNNVPLEQLATFFQGLCETLVIEFVPKSDSQVRRLLASRVDIFPDYHEEGFEAAFGQRFEIIQRLKVEETDRHLYLLRARSN